MTGDDIAKARAVIAAASNGPATWTADESETDEAAFARLRLAFDGARKLTGSTALHTVEVERRDDGTCLVMAITGNGPLAPANAKYIACSLDPVAGWSAALDEVEHLAKLSALAERAMNSANEASKGFEALAHRALDRNERLEVVADAARAVVAAHGDEGSPVADEVRALKRALDGAPVARFQVERNRKTSGVRMQLPSPAYATDGIAIPRRKRRVLLDLAPESASSLLEAVRERTARRAGDDGPVGTTMLERMLVDALERAR